MNKELCDKKTAYLVEPIRSLVRMYLSHNPAACAFLENHKAYGVEEFFIDHITPRTQKPLPDKTRRFELAGFPFKIRYDYPISNWVAHVHVSPHPNQPVIFTDRSPDSSHIISRWIDEFPEDVPIYLLHHIACRVGPELEPVINKMEKDGFHFAMREGVWVYKGLMQPDILSGYGGKLKQIFTKPVMMQGASGNIVAGTVFELIYRHESLAPWTFLEEQANTLMEQSQKTS